MRLTISRKLILGFAIVVLLAVAQAVAQLVKFRDALDLLDAIARHDTAVYSTVTSVAESRAVLQSRREGAFSAAALAGGGANPPGVPALLDAYRTEARRAAEALEKLTQLSDELSDRGFTAARRQLWAELSRRAKAVQTVLGELVAANERMFEALMAGRLPDAAALRQSINATSAQMEKDLQGLEEIATQLTHVGREGMQATFQDMIMVSVGAIALVAVFAAAAAFLIGRSIYLPLTRFVAIARRVGAGDLTGELAVSSRDELGALASALNEMSQNLRGIATRTRAAAENLNSSTAQIRASTQEQAAAVAEQLAAIEETSATLTEITQSGAHMSERAQEVIAGAQGSVATADQGLRAVEDTVGAMGSIREQVETLAENIVQLSQRTQVIGDIIRTVHIIAERSHLLALNASIEAAAAGEHGRTFSVVAGEIKKLADQAREATAQVRSNLSEVQQGINASVMLIEEAAKRVASGRNQTDATERTIRRMTEDIQENVQAFQQIVAGINQHQIGLEQVMQALQSIRSASTQTAGTTRQLETAATNMNDLSEDLVGAVRNYMV